MWLEQNKNIVIYIRIHVKNNEKAAHILNVSNSMRLNRMPAFFTEFLYSIDSN